MTSPDKKVTDHYTIGRLGVLLLEALKKAGTDIDALTVDDLAPVDAFHIRGRMATEELAQWADVQAGHEVIDVGCGIGGAGRYLATTTGCSVVGVDLTEEYCQVANMLSDRVGLAERTTFQQGSALSLPFDDGRFDVAWTEHVQMNIPDKAAFYREIKRVLRPGGRFAFHDILAGENNGLRVPVPWAGDESISHLIPVDELAHLLGDIGFERIRWEDKSAASAAFFDTALDNLKKKGLMQVGIHLLMGDDAIEKLANVRRNLSADHIRVVAAVMRNEGA